MDGVSPEAVQRIKDRLNTANTMKNVAERVEALTDDMWLAWYAVDVALLLDAIESPHQHTFVFLSEECRATKWWGDRVEERMVYDVFFCSGCLTKARKESRREQPSRRELSGWDVVWRADA